MPESGLIQAWASAATPPPDLTVSEWSDDHRLLPQSSAARGARWRTDHVPYLRGIMDAIHEPGVRKMAIAKAGQVGGSEAIQNIIGYFMQHDPAPMLLIHPTEGAAEEYSKERLDDMLRSTPALAATIDEAKSTLLLKMFAGGYLAIGGANSPNTFARRAARVVIGDDIDRFPAIVGEEGDPIELMAKRTTTFTDGLVILVSTPTLKGGRIDTAYDQGDQRQYFVTCPECGREDFITWQDRAHFSVGYTDHEPDTARLVCASEDHGGCGAWLTEAQRRTMVMSDDWRPTATPKEQGCISFKLPAMVTTLGDASLSAWAADWIAKRGRGKEALRSFVNTTLAEGWEDRGVKMNPHGLVARKEDYGPEIEVPAGGVFLSCFVDVQINRFILQVWAWGLAAERWVVDVRTVIGNPKTTEGRAELLSALKRKYTHASGALLPIHVTCVDTGWASDEMYDFVLANQAMRVFATKGVAGRSGQPIVGKPSEARRGGGRPVRLYLINTDDAKSDFMDTLSIDTPGPGYLHFPRHLDELNEEYFSQLCSEHKEKRKNRAGVVVGEVWVAHRTDNHHLDTSVGNLAGFRIANPNIRQMLEALPKAQVLAAKASAAAQAPGAPTAPGAPKRKVSRSGYLNS